MNKNEKENLKQFIEEYLNEKGIDTSKNFFNCINPEHPDVHPSMSIDRTRNRVHCFSCGATYDIYDCIRILEGFVLDKEVFKFAENKYYKNRSTIPIKKDSEPLEKQLSYPNLTINGERYLKSRNISSKTAEFFNLSSKDNYLVAQNTFWNTIIIPVNKESYVFRNTDTTADKKDRIRKRGPSTIFNQQALSTDVVFVVEGEFDVFSLHEAGAQAVGLGSTANYKQFISIIKARKDNPLFILSLDNDESGAKTQKRLSEELTELKIPFIEENIAGDFKDANEFLVNDRASFLKCIENILKSNLDIKSLEEKLYLENAAVNVIPKLRSEKSIATGFTKLDSVLDGGLFNELYILGGASSVGKTTYMLQMIDQIAKHNDVILFSLEMSKTTIVAKSLSRILTSVAKPEDRLTSRMITSGDTPLNLTQQQSLKKAIEEYKTFATNIFILEGLTTDITEVIDNIDKHIKIRKTKPVVFIDYLQLLESDVKNSDKQNIDKCIKELKRASRRLEVPIVAISSFSRAGYREEATMESFKESGSIEYSSDTLLALQFADINNKNFNLNKAKKQKIRDIQVVVLKNRNGCTGNIINYEYLAEHNLFSEGEST